MSHELQNTMPATKSPWASNNQQAAKQTLSLIIAWSDAEPTRVGELARLTPDRQYILGRGPSLPDDPGQRLMFTPARPTGEIPRTEILGPQISRRQLSLIARTDRIDVEKIGACPMLINGGLTDVGSLRPGDTLHLRDQLLLVCASVSEDSAHLRSFPVSALGKYGGADKFGMVGESEALNRLRDELDFVSKSVGHVLILGESGVGKEVAARAIHRLSGRGNRTMVSRSAATIPDGLIDAELFGNVGNYPNPGMKDRPGLIGEADGSSLFLDEIGELPAPLQARLLRVLDSSGEYTRLGEARSRKSDLRLIAATNRGVEELKHDFSARFTFRVTVPGLNQRRSDIPLLIQHLLARAVDANPEVARRFCATMPDGTLGPARIAPDVIDRLIRFEYTLHIRELDALLWRGMLSSTNDFIGLTEALESELSAGAPESIPPTDITEEQVRDSLIRHAGNVTRAARELGVKNRYVLYRLMKKWNISEKTGT